MYGLLTPQRATNLTSVVMLARRCHTANRICCSDDVDPPRRLLFQFHSAAGTGRRTNVWARQEFNLCARGGSAGL